jgi:hypothetical protein
LDETGLKMRRAAMKWLGLKAAGRTPEVAPERVFGEPRPMTGFLATLTPEQRDAALAHRGDDSFGDTAMEKAKV